MVETAALFEALTAGLPVDDAEIYAAAWVDAERRPIPGHVAMK